jgi:aromatic-L-amino-acid decarboxylase
VDFSLVCFRYAPPGVDELECDRRNEAIMHHVNAGGEAYLSHTKLGGRLTLRAAIGNIRTQEQHVCVLWERLQEAAKHVTR